jgi:hypothetical protein
MRAVPSGISTQSASLWPIKTLPDQPDLWSAHRASNVAGMTDVTASDFRHPRRYVRLDTILRLRWLAALGQLAAIFIVVQGLDFEVPVLPCMAIIGFSTALNLVLQMLFNPMQRLEPRYAAALLALNIAELAALLYCTGGLQNPFSFLFLAPVLISATALPTRLTIALGVFAAACATVLAFFHLPLPWDADEPLVLPQIYLLGVWISILTAIGVTSLYAFQVTEEARKLSDALAATELVLTREQHLTQLDGLAAAAAHELGTPLSTIFLISRELEKTVHDNPELADDLKTLREQAQRCRDILSKITQLNSSGAPFDRMALHADRGSRGAAPRFRHRHQGPDRGSRRRRTGRHAQSRDPLRRRQYPGKRRRLRPRDGRGQCVVERRQHRDLDIRRRPGHSAGPAEADRRTLSVAAPRRRRAAERTHRARARRIHRPDVAGAHRRESLVRQPGVPRSWRRGADRLAARKF